jgi:hypothetical protein
MVTQSLIGSTSRRRTGRVCGGCGTRKLAVRWRVLEVIDFEVVDGTPVLYVLDALHRNEEAVVEKKRRAQPIRLGTPAVASPYATASIRDMRITE